MVVKNPYFRFQYFIVELMLVECNDGKSQYPRLKIPSTDYKPLNHKVKIFHDAHIEPLLVTWNLFPLISASYLAILHNVSIVYFTFSRMFRVLLLQICPLRMYVTIYGCHYKMDLWPILMLHSQL